jgi:hypothetical protein
VIHCGLQRILLSFALAAGLGTSALAHDVITTNITFDREILRLIHARCATCHRPGGTAFSLLTYNEARPWAVAIKEETLRRRMPPWGAIKGFGEFRNDQGLSSEELELIVSWSDGGVPEGNEKDIPPPPKFSEEKYTHRKNEIVIEGDYKLTRALSLDGLWPAEVPTGTTMKITAQLPDGAILPLLWLKEYRPAFGHPFLLHNPPDLPAGTWIRGVAKGSKIALLPYTGPGSK